MTVEPYGHESAATTSPMPKLADSISDRLVRQLYVRMLERFRGLHSDVEVIEGEMDVRIEYHNLLFCRMVPYRELIHVQIGEGPTWETRVRTESDSYAALDRGLRTFFEMLAKGPAVSVRPLGRS